MIQWRLKAVMGEKHVTNIQLATALGIDRRVVSRWRNPRYMPKRIDVGLLDLMCGILGCEVGDLLIYKKDEADVGS